MTLGFVNEFDAAADILEAWSDAIQQSPKTAKVFISGTVKASIENWIIELIIPAMYPNPVKLPFKFKTHKSQKYYFGFVAKRDSLGNVIPYQRTGSLVEDWEVLLGSNPLQLTIFHPGIADRFVIGKDQQPGHVNTGHPRVDIIIIEIYELATDMSIDGWFSIIDFNGVLV